MNERELTGLMYKLLSPKENLECGRLYLELFDKHVLRLGMSAEELDSAKVHEQYPTKLLAEKLKIPLKKAKKMDFAIITSRRFIPIEVKLESGSGKSQCDYYFGEAQLHTQKFSLSEPPVLYYLTLHGYFPERSSASSSGYGAADELTIHQDKIKKVTFRTELLPWLEECSQHAPENFSLRNNLSRLLSFVRRITQRTGEQLQVEEIMRKFFAALEKRFDENFCRKHRLEFYAGDEQPYHQEILKFFFKGHSAPGINFLCTDAAGNVIKLEADKELLFGVECYNGGENDFRRARTLVANFAIYDSSINNCVCKRTDIKRLLDGKNILPQEFIKEYWQKGQKLAGMIGRIDLHDAHGDTIDFYDVDKTLTQFKNSAAIDRAVDNIMTETENLLRRFVYG
ncbi:MAG: PD-(D/E)XK nuclease family protein [Selenomonadaceae bacterium]|nr:PD-(D/E)XK nuclease family protein [Selenomonadaceae bacterium]